MILGLSGWLKLYLLLFVIAVSFVLVLGFLHLVLGINMWISLLILFLGSLGWGLVETNLRRNGR